MSLGRIGPRDRRARRCVDRHGRERLPARVGRRRDVLRRPAAGHPASREAGRAADLLFAGDHRHLVRAGLPARSAGRPDVPAARVHQDVCDDGGLPPVHHARPRPDDDLHRGKRLTPESRNPMSRLFASMYEPIIRLALRWKWAALLVNVAVIPLTIPLLFTIGSEFMPPLYEGSQLYMPTSPPGLSITEATRLLQVQDKILRTFPEVETVFGTVGRGTTSTDNTPMGMVNTTVTLKPREQWRQRHDARPIAGRHGRAAAVSRVSQRLDAADSQPAGHAAHRHQDAGGHQDPRVRPERDPADWRRDRTDAAEHPGDAQRLRRTRRSRIFHRHSHRPRRHRTPRPDRRGRRGRHRVRDRRPEHHAHDRRARAVSRQRPVRAGVPRQSARPAAGARQEPGGRADSAGPARRDHADDRAGDDPGRERAARRIRVRRYGHERHRGLRRSGEARRCRAR